MNEKHAEDKRKKIEIAEQHSTCRCSKHRELAIDENNETYLYENII